MSNKRKKAKENKPISDFKSDNGVCIKQESKDISFDFREKRLKLVYKIMYVLAALWIGVVLSSTQISKSNQLVNFYSFVLTLTSVTIVRILKYVILELRCLKIYQDDNEKSLLELTEIKYDSIWSFLGITIAIDALLFCLISLCPNITTGKIPIIMILGGLLSIYFTWMINFILTGRFAKSKNIKTQTNKRITVITELLYLLFGNVAAYSLYYISLNTMTV